MGYIGLPVLKAERVWLNERAWARSAPPSAPSPTEPSASLGCSCDYPQGAVVVQTSLPCLFYAEPDRPIGRTQLATRTLAGPAATQCSREIV